MALRFPAPLDAASFLAQYWQRAPLYLPQALAAITPLAADELAGLACEEDVESRLVYSPPNPWRVEHGPFNADTFAQLPDIGWTLLVQDVDKHLPTVAALLDHFSFLPRWRIDDIMVSYAAPGGTVGPHVDEYDVFLLQAEGKRSWQIGDGEGCQPNLPLRVLEKFSPQNSWQLEPGDMLYLPPGVAHYGHGDRACTTYSIGFRAPSMAEMILRRAEHAAAHVAGRYRDADLTLDEASGALISRAAVSRALQHLDSDEDVAAAVAWFGCLVTENKPWLVPEPHDHDDFDEQFRGGAHLRKESAVRMAHSDFPASGLLFVDGDSYGLDRSGAGIAAQLCRGDAVPAASSGGAVALLRQLYRDGKIYFENES